MIHHFDHRYANSNADGDFYEVTLEQKASSEFEPSPRYWVPQAEVNDRLARQNWKSEWLLGWRNVCRSTDERTLIASIVPRAAVGHSMPLMFPIIADTRIAGFISCLTALTTDYVLRQKQGGINLTFGFLFQIPIQPPSFYNEPRLAFITPKVLELTYTSHSLAPFARDLGHDGPPFAWDEDRRAHLRADLDAFYARAYGLTRDELRYILDPADVKGPDYPSETFRVLKEKEIRLHGEYRTRRLVLAAWDRMEANGEFTAMGM